MPEPASAGASPPAAPPTIAWLRGIVDYAGLFPPASRDMAAAAQEYAAVQRGDERWMLGRFVLPAARLEEFDSVAGALLPRASASTWALSALLGSDIEEDVQRITAFNARHVDVRAGAVYVDTVEVKVFSPRDAARAAELLDRQFDCYMEVPVAEDPARIVEAIAAAGASAKVRTGGVTPDIFPAADHVVRFITRCVDHAVSFKATAGLHHAWYGEYPMTYAADSASTTMFGFLNVVLATAAVHAGWPADDSARVLEERGGAAVRVEPDGVRWHDRILDRVVLERARASLRSFGSCSFMDPVRDLHELRLL